MSWYAPAPQTPAHHARTAVRFTVWGLAPTIALILCDPSVRAGLGL